MNDSIAGFIGGAIAGLLGGIRLFTYPMQVYTGHQAADMAIDFSAKVLGTIILGVVGGAFGVFSKMFAQDLYKHLKDKYKKRKNEGQ